MFTDELRAALRFAHAVLASGQVGVDVSDLEFSKSLASSPSRTFICEHFKRTNSLEWVQVILLEGCQDYLLCTHSARRSLEISALAQ